MNSFEFKHNKPRLTIIGHGNISKRILKQKFFHNDGKVNKSFSENFKVYIISRNGMRNLEKKFQEFLKSKKVSELKYDLSNYSDMKKVTSISSFKIILLPTKESSFKFNLNSEEDVLTRNFAVSFKKKISSKGVYISTTGVYGNANGALIDETFRCNPSNFRSKRRLYAEKINRKNTNFHILRVPGIYAKERLPIERIKENKPALISNEDVFSNHIHADDLARVTYISLFRGKKNRVTNVVDDSKIKMGDYFDLVAKTFSLSKPPRVKKAEIKKYVEKKILSPMMVTFMKDSRRLKNYRLKKEMRYSLRYPDVSYALKKFKNEK